MTNKKERSSATNDYHTDYTSETLSGDPITFSGKDVSKKLNDLWIITDDDLEMVKVKIPLSAQSASDQIDAIYHKNGTNGCVQNKLLDAFTNTEIAGAGFVPWVDGFYYNHSLDNSKNNDF